VKLLYFLSLILAFPNGNSGDQAATLTGEGTAMFFLIRTAFWLLIIVLLLPSEGQQKNQIYSTAEATVRDLAGFCDRNPDTCETGKNAFNVLVSKAEFGAQLLMGYVKERTGMDVGQASAFADPIADAEVPTVDPVAWNSSDPSEDTLKPEDREIAWGGRSE
jgi:hypothetical protein